MSGMGHNRYWTGPPPPPEPKDCKHRSMSFILADSFVSIRCKDCDTQAALHIDQEFSTDQAQAALNTARDVHIPILSAQDLEKMWGKT